MRNTAATDEALVQRLAFKNRNAYEQDQFRAVVERIKIRNLIQAATLTRLQEVRQ